MQNERNKTKTMVRNRRGRAEKGNKNNKFTHHIINPCNYIIPLPSNPTERTSKTSQSGNSLEKTSSDKYAPCHAFAVVHIMSSHHRIIKVSPQAEEASNPLAWRCARGNGSDQERRPGLFLF
ncbi:hypothetical protein VTH06DRAFT_4432 [Thermothelomyces fergusii]